MNEALLRQFDEHWESFVASLRGNLSRIKKLSFYAAEMAIENARTDWVARDTVYGRWFMKVENENPQIAQVVEDILTKDMKFTEFKQPAHYPDMLQYAIPVAGAGVAGVSYQLLVKSATLIQKAAVPIVAAGLLYIVTKQVTANVSSANAEKTLERYMEQLNVYHDSVIAALKA